MKKRMAGGREHRQRRIHPHCRNGFPAVFCHGENAVFYLLIGIPESLLHPFQFPGSKLRHPLVGNFQVMEMHQIPVKPFPIGLP